MQQYLAILAVAAGGAIGSVCRYMFSNWFLQIVGPGFPWGTFTINVTGAFIIGVVLQIAAGQPDFSPYLRLFLATGILGGYKQQACRVTAEALLVSSQRALVLSGNPLEGEEFCVYQRASIRAV